jgi:hypothetical protein
MKTVVRSLLANSILTVALLLLPCVAQAQDTRGLSPVDSQTSIRNLTNFVVSSVEEIWEAIRSLKADTDNAAPKMDEIIRRLDALESRLDLLSARGVDSGATNPNRVPGGTWNFEGLHDPTKPGIGGGGSWREGFDVAGVYERLRQIPGGQFFVSDNEFQFYLPLAVADRNGVAEAEGVIRGFGGVEALRMQLILPDAAVTPEASRIALTRLPAGVAYTWAAGEGRISLPAVQPSLQIGAMIELLESLGSAMDGR